MIPASITATALLVCLWAAWKGLCVLTGELERMRLAYEASSTIVPPVGIDDLTAVALRVDALPGTWEAAVERMAEYAEKSERERKRVDALYRSAVKRLEGGEGARTMEELAAESSNPYPVGSEADGLSVLPTRLGNGARPQAASVWKFQ